MKMHELIDNFPDMMQDAFSLARGAKISPPGRLANIVIAGMGGSAIGGDLISAVFGPRIGIPIIIDRSYSLPHYLNEKTLLFAVSYSGDTEETLSVLREGLKKSARIFCITSGGKLLRLAKKNKIPVVRIRPNLPPRAALPYLFIPILLVLEELKLIAPVKAELIRSEKFIRKIASQTRRAAADFAPKIQGKIPVIYGSSGITQAAAYRLKTQLNENSKVYAAYNSFPELTHNELVALRDPNLAVLIFRDKKEKAKIRKRIEALKGLIKNKVGAVYEINSRGRSDLERLLSLIVFGDYLSVYLADLRGVDPDQIELINRLKELLK